MARPADPNAHAALVAAARAEFVKNGILKARIEDITQACGLSKGAFYLHFESKEALFRELTCAIQADFERLLTERERASCALLEARGPGEAPLLDVEFARRVAEQDVAADRRLFELMWAWRDVIDVLLRGCQGTQFDGIMWELLDQYLERVQRQFRDLQARRLMRDDVAPELMGMMVLGTYLFVVRRLVQSPDRPDFDELVAGLHEVMARGTSAAPRLQRTQPAPRTSRVAGPVGLRTKRRKQPKHKKRSVES